MNCIGPNDQAITTLEQVEIAETYEETIEYLEDSYEEDSFLDTIEF